MNYRKHYTLLIEKRKTHPAEGYTERHHILPQSWGGDDSPENLVRLTAREHLIAHLLLFKMSSGKQKAAMAAAVILLGGHSSRKYQSIREYQSKIMSERSSRLMRENNPFKGRPSNIANRKWVTNGTDNMLIYPNETVPSGWRYGRTIALTEEGKLKKSISMASYNKTRTNPLKGKTWKMSEAAKVKCSEAAKKREASRRLSGRPSLSSVHRWTKDRVWVNLSGKSKMIHAAQLSEHESIGWTRGRGNLKQHQD